MKTTLIGLIFLTILVAGCSDDRKDTAVARVYDEYLDLSELAGIVPEGVTGDDSLKIVRDFIQKWIKERLLIKHAESKLDKEQKDFTRQLEEYRNSLLIYTYEQELIRQKLDTVVTDKEIEKYYEANKTDFELKDNIVKVWYVKLLRNTNPNPFRQLIRSDKPADQQKLAELCARQAVNSYLDDNTWLVFNDILKEIPIKTYNQEDFLKYNRYIEIQDSNYLYLLNIKGFMIKESISPLSFEKDNIRNIILSKRKLKLISDLEQNLYREALRKGNFEIFEPHPLNKK